MRWSTGLSIFFIPFLLFVSAQEIIEVNSSSHVTDDGDRIFIYELHGCAREYGIYNVVRFP